MEPVEWLKAHRSEILEHWQHRVQPLVGDVGASTPWEKRIDSAFDQVCLLMTEDQCDVTDAEVEAKLFACSRIKGEENHRFSAELLASGRRAIHEVSSASDDAAAQRYAAQCGTVIDYLQAMLRMNVCRDCKEINCCMRLESFDPL